jgi:hypothetical protein
MIHIKENLLQLKSIFNMINNMGAECNLTFMPEGLFIRIVNGSNIAMIITTIKKSFFEEYNIEEEKTYTIDNQALMKIISILGKNELYLKILPTGIEFKNEKDDKLLLNYYIGQKDERKVPPEGDGIKWKLNPGKFINTLGEVIEIGNVGIFTGENKLTLKLKSQLINGELFLDAEKISGNKVDAYYDMGEFIFISTIRHVFDEVEFGYDDQKCYMKGSNNNIDFKWILAGRLPDDN